MPPAIIVTGNPVDGTHHIGPFTSDDDANEYADTHLHGAEWWVTTLAVPHHSAGQDASSA